jgi:hypothetical protein
MSNQIKNIGGVAKELLYQLDNKLSFMKGVKNKYSNEFAQDGAKIGDTINVKWIENVPVKRGPVAEVQPFVEKTLPIQITDDYWYQTAIEFGSKELALSIEDFNAKTNLEQIMASMANEIEEDVLKLALKTPNMLGTPASTPGTTAGAGYLRSGAPVIFGNASAVLTQMGAPRNNRTMALDTTAMANSVGANAALFNPSADISSQYREGRITRNMNFDFIENVNIPTIVTGTRTAGTVLVSSTNGDSTIQVTGVGANATVNAGEHFIVTGVFGVNPMSQNSTPFNRMFVVLADAVANAAGQITLSIAPEIRLSNPAKLVGGTLVKRYPALPIDVNGNVTALPTAGAVVTFSGAASTTTVLNLAHQQDAIVTTSVDLPLIGGADKCVRVSHNGISLRLWTDGDIHNSTKITRIDTIIVPTLVRPDLAVVLFG